MQMLQFIAACLSPGSLYAVAGLAAASASGSSDDRASSSSQAFSVKAAESGSSPSSQSSSSTDDRGLRFFTTQSSSATSICFGAGSPRRLLRWGARPRASAKQAEANMAPKGDAVGRYLRKISRRLRKARSAAKGSPSPTGAAVDDTARERAESVARAIAYCKETLRRGAARVAPSPSLDDWLHGRQEEIIAGAAAHCNERADSQPTPPRCRLAGLPLGMQSMGKQWKESPCPPNSPSRGGGSLNAGAVVHGKEPPHHEHYAGDECHGEVVTAAETATSSSAPSDDLAAGELEMLRTFYEMEFLKIFDGDEEMINRHFISVQI